MGHFVVNPDFLKLLSTLLMVKNGLAHWSLVVLPGLFEGLRHQTQQLGPILKIIIKFKLKKLSSKTGQCIHKKKKNIARLNKTHNIFKINRVSFYSLSS